MSCSFGASGPTKRGLVIGLTCLVEKFPISSLANDILKSMCEYVFGRGPGLVSL